MELQRGERVEVCRKLDGFVGSYYVGTVISRIGGDNFIVEYGTLLSDDKLAPLREVIAGGEIRPRPPIVKVSDFAPREEVDAWHNDGWWRATVVRRWRKPKKYQIYLEETGEHKYCNLPELRAHLDWVDGRWVCIRKDSV